MSDNIHSFADHPVRIRALVEKLTLDLSSVDFSTNLNELVQARKVSMQAIWAVLESGHIDEQHIKRNENGLYLKMIDVIAGVHIEVDLLIENTSNRILVLWAEEYEEE